MILLPFSTVLATSPPGVFILLIPPTTVQATAKKIEQCQLALLDFLI
jgi:hypothetical protein